MENNQYPTILVLGASGTIGKQVVKDLESKAIKVRITSRKQDVVEQLCSEGKDCKYQASASLSQKGRIGSMRCLSLERDGIRRLLIQEIS